MTLSDGVRGIFQNILREKSDEGVLRDATYIHAERYSSKLSKPLPGQSLAAHRKWIDCWQNVEVADPALLHSALVDECEPAVSVCPTLEASARESIETNCTHCGRFHAR